MQIKRSMERIPGGLMVVPLLLGALCNTFFPNTPKIFGSFTGGLFTGATSILAVYYVCMGATISFAALAAAGWPLLLGIVGTVLGAIGLSFGIGRLCKLPWKMALLIACGNAICGNSAIAAVAPVRIVGSKKLRPFA